MCVILGQFMGEKKKTFCKPDKQRQWLIKVSMRRLGRFSRGGFLSFLPLCSPPLLPFFCLFVFEFKFYQYFEDFLSTEVVFLLVEF